MIGLAASLLGRNEEAATWFRRSLEFNRNFALSRFFHAAALANLGQMEEARSEADAGLALDPHFTIASFQSAWSSNPTYVAQREPILDGLRKAGVPEGTAKTN
jgi:tetratricopeptide (TPR) repeat protein